MSATRKRCLAALLVATFGGAGSLGAQLACLMPVRLAAWPAPLNRIVDIDVPQMTLRAALDNVSATSGVRLAWSPDLVPLERRSCDLRGRMAVGDALFTLLRGTGIEPVALGGVDVALTPARSLSSTPTIRTIGEVKVLDGVTVIGAPTGIPSSGTSGTTVLSSRDLIAYDVRSIPRAMNELVPGMWAWEPAVGTIAARYASVRGASSFGVTAPKIYIDGIEAANSLLITQLDPHAVDRIEVIRGPQGAGVFGADAISGVVNIISRSGVDRSAPRVQLRSSAGTSTSAYASQPVAAQRHELLLRAGSPLHAAGLSLAYHSIGAFVPGASSHEASGIGDARVVSRFGALTINGRYLGTESGYGPNPLLNSIWAKRSAMRASDAAAVRDTLRSWQGAVVTMPQRMNQYGLSAQALLPSLGRWTPSATLGVDGYRLRNVAVVPLVARSATDSAVQAAIGEADRMTARASAVARYGSESTLLSTTRVSVEHSSLHEATNAAGVVRGSEATPAWSASTGLVMQATTSFRRTVELTTGLRIERMTTAADPIHAALPTLAAAAHRSAGRATWTLRGAYGAGIRPARLEVADASMVGGTFRRVIARSDLPPERQSGVEVGLSVDVPNLWSLSLTRFDQRASNLLQSVPAVVFDSVRHLPRFVTEVQGVGAIANRGWEAAGGLTLGAVALTGTWTTVDSRVVHLAPGYSGDLRVGDRMFEVPKHTLGLTAQLLSSRLSGTIGISRAFDWVNYDRLAMANAMVSQAQSLRRFDANALRGYWLEYPGVTRLRTTLSYPLTRGLGVVFSGENLLGDQRGEPDNLTIVQGRTITLGLRARR